MAVVFQDENDSKDIILHTGDIVVISDYGNVKWLVCRGWYTYNRSRMYGWYFKSIPDSRILPDYAVTLEDVKVLSSEYVEKDEVEEIEPPKKPHHRPHCPPPEPHNHHNHCDNCFVTVDTIAERNALGHPYPPDGKLVRVNEVKGETKYYSWNSEDLKWDPWSIGEAIIDEVVNELVTEKLTTVENRIEKVEKWILLDQEGSENDEEDPTEPVEEEVI